MDEKIRTFIAIDLPDAVRQVMAECQEKLRRAGLGLRWVKPAGIHLTLKFLGDIEREVIAQIHGAMEQAAREAAPFVLKGDGLGVFPDFKRPRVLWMGLSGDMERLVDLQRNLDARLRGLGFAREKRAFKGHLTLGRVKGRLDGNQLRRALQRFEGFGTEAFTAEAVTLFQSDLRPSGAVYTHLAEVRFRGAGMME